MSSGRINSGKKGSAPVEWDAQSLSEISGSFWKGCALQAAVKLDIFTLLAGGEKTAVELASMIQGDQRGVAALLDALSSMGLLCKEEDRYILTEASSRHLSRKSDSYMGWRILHHHFLLPSWAGLDEAVKKGKPISSERHSINQEEQREAFLMAMYSNALALSERITPFIELGDAGSLLDLGGGPGTYAIQFCRKYPGLQAVVYDLPASRPYAEDTIRKFNMQERIQFAGGDFFVDDIPGEYDVIWLSHVLHSSGPEKCGHLVKKAAGCLKPGGRFLIHDFWLDENGAGPEFPALFALNMLVRTGEGRSYRESEAFQMLREAGLHDIHRLEITIPNDSAVISGRKPK